MTLTETSKKLDENKILSLRFVLSQYHLLFLGYSGYDNDVAPEITNYRMTFPFNKEEPIYVPFEKDDIDIVKNLYNLKMKRARRVYWLVHKKESSERQKIVESILTTYGQDGFIIKSDLESIAKSICKSINNIDLEIDEINFGNFHSYVQFFEEIFKKELQQWANSLNICRRFAMLSKLLLTGHIFNYSKLLIETAFQHFRDCQDNPYTIDQLLDLQIIENDINGAMTSLNLFRKAWLKIYKEGKLDRNAMIYLHLYEGDQLAKLCLWNDAKRVLYSAYREIRRTKDELSICNILNKLAACYLHLKKTDVAEKCLLKAKEIIKVKMDKFSYKQNLEAIELLALTKANLGYVYIEENNKMKAINIMLEAINWHMKVET